MRLIIGNKNLSSWSMRPWLVLTHFDVAFDEELIRLDEPETRKQIAARSPSGLVPCLVDGDTVVWDSLAICEYLAESHPSKAMWPEDRVARARARCLACEMHSGFSALRTIWPMDINSEGARVALPIAVRRDLTRLFEGWSAARDAFGAGGPFLFGQFTIADAFFAPVVSRIRTYGPVDCDTATQAYLDAVWDAPAVRKWREGAAAEAGWASWKV